ncbi:MAG: hypothetical protein Hals2KO_18600 [Halioglobus sp.]
MQIATTVLALLLPGLCAGLCLNLFVPRGTTARALNVWGCGTLLGLIALPQLMRLLDARGFALEFVSIAAILAVVSLIALGLTLRSPAYRAPRAPVEFPASRAQQLLFALLLGLITLRLITLGLEVIWRPLYPWDATMHWATKARVWFDNQAIVPFVNAQEWLELGGEGVFTDRHPHYPATIPLLQVWMNLGHGEWNESLMNLPWLLCLGALGAAFYGQLRLSGLSTTLALVATYLLLSLPLVNIHVALAGYADLFLGASYGCSVMCLHNWLRRRQSWLAALALLFAVACPLIKNEGVIWFLSLVPATTVAFMQPRQAAKLFMLGLLGGILLLLILPEEFEVAGYSIAQLRPEFNLGAVLGIVQNIWVHDSWHLFGYFMLVLFPLGLVMPGAMTKTYLAATATLACSVTAYLFLFVFTPFSVGAVNFAAVGRLSIQLAPALMFLCALLYNELLRRENFWVAPQQP